MELRHLRYFIAVAEEGSLTLAAEKRLHTSQPSLSRQIRDLEYEVGVQLMSRSVHGIELTAAGRAFLDHARLSLTQACPSTNTSIARTGLSSPTYSSSTAGNNVLCWRSVPSTKRFIRSPANRGESYRANHATQKRFHTAWTQSCPDPAAPYASS